MVFLKTFDTLLFPSSLLVPVPRRRKKTTPGADEAVMRCLGRILHVDPSTLHTSVNQAATLHFSLGRLGIWSAFWSREAAQWASWADCLAMVKARHPIVPARMIGEIGRFTSIACLDDVQACALAHAVDIELPSWSELANGARPLPVMRRTNPIMVATRSLNES